MVREPPRAARLFLPYTFTELPDKGGQPLGLTWSLATTAMRSVIDPP
jgi:hypothetical protein